jgi:subtilisin family serine protease
MPGPIIVTDCVNNRTVIKIYDAAGRPVATIYEQSIRANNNIIRDMIKRAKSGVPAQVAGGQLDLSNIGADADSIIVLESGVTDDEIDVISDLLRAELKRKGCKKAADAVKQAAGVDFIEKLMERDVQSGKINVKVEPNDPFYFDLSSHKEVKGRGRDINTAYGEPLKVGDTLIERIVAFTQKRPTPDQWGLHAIGFTPKFDPESAWHLFDSSKKNVVVAIIDSGLDLEQPDGPKFLWTNTKEIADNGKDDDNNGYIDDIHGWNFLDDNNDLTDYKGHGTIVAGIIAAQTNNGVGIAGINPGAQIMVLKVTDEKGKANNLNIYRALRYAADNGARVINISLGAKGVSRLEQMGINYAFNKGSLIIIAAGNQSQDIKKYGPPASRRALTVAAADTKGSRIWFSNNGVNVGLIAPGEHIYSLYSKDSPWHGPSFIKERICYPSTGTSFSAPIVSAVASLIFAKDPRLTNREVEDILLDSAEDWESEGWDHYTGAGFLDARKALKKSAKGILTLRFMDLVVNRDKKKKVSSVELFAIMRGDIASYSVSLGKGLKPKKWDVIYESSVPLSSDEFFYRIDKELVKRGKHWNVRISLKDKHGKTKIATMPFSVK